MPVFTGQRLILKGKLSDTLRQPVMTRIPLPSIDALVAFESAARHESFTRAAAELNVTQGAISRQIRVLEERLGSSLFQRIRQHVVLTDAGRAYLLEINRVLRELESATLRLMTFGESTNVLNLAVLPAVATHWLFPRLPDFLERHRELSVNCTIRLSPFDFKEDPFDAAFHYGLPIWAGGVVYPLMDESIVPVCSPSFRRLQQIQKLEDLTRVPLLHLTTRPRQWAEWFASGKLVAANAFQGSVFESFALLKAAVQAGLGVGLLPTYFVEQELRAGSLLSLAPPRESTNAYYLVVPESRMATAYVQSFVKWIEEQTAVKRGRRRILRDKRRNKVAPSAKRDIENSSRKA
jgi:LysR family glycine cleavage system transcriptional activator